LSALLGVFSWEPSELLVREACAVASIQHLDLSQQRL
jgi:hypothetical protein